MKNKKQTYLIEIVITSNVSLTILDLNLKELKEDKMNLESHNFKVRYFKLSEVK